MQAYELATQTANTIAVTNETSFRFRFISLECLLNDFDHLNNVEPDVEIPVDETTYCYDAPYSFAKGDGMTGVKVALTIES
jgi:hypothetical protein